MKTRIPLLSVTISLALLGFNGSQEADAMAHPGCLEMFATHCDRLYSRPIKTRNGISTPSYEYASAVLKGKNALPEDFRDSLEALGYFRLLKAFMGRCDSNASSPDERLRLNSLESELTGKWEAAMTNTVSRRTKAKFGINGDVPAHLLRPTRWRLASQISRAIWRGSPGWRSAVSSFRRIKARFFGTIERLDIPLDVKSRWRDRLRGTRLVLPGQIDGLDDDDCIRTESNAYYNADTNSVVLCAGEFNGDEMTSTLAHELGHALDLDSAFVRFQMGSRLEKRLSGLRQQVCRQEAFSCEDWSRFQQRLPKELLELRSYRPELPEFQACLQEGVPLRPLSPPDFQRMAEIEVSESIADLAEDAVLSGIMTPRLRLSNGRSIQNPGYLDPCRYEPGPSPGKPRILDDPLNWLTFMVAEFRCSSGEVPGRFEKAIERAREMGIEITRELQRMEGRFSSRDLLISEGYASSPVEHFSDTLASYLLADLLGQVPSPSLRRELFLDENSSSCEELRQESPNSALAMIEQGYARELHGLGTRRSVYRFTQPIREALSCRNDLPVGNCELKRR